MSKHRLELKWALIFCAMMLSWMALEKAVGLHDVHIAQHMVWTNLVAVPAIAIYVLALLEKRRKLGGAMSWKEGFFSGMIITLIVTVLTPLTQYITSSLITPEYFANVTRFSVEQGMMTQEAAEANFNLHSYMVQATIGALIMGTVTSALVALFVKRKARV